MPLYGTPQAGNVVTAVNPADNYTLFANETPAAGTTDASCSVAFARGVGEGIQPSGIMFTASWATAPGGGGAQVDIMASNQEIDGTYQVIGSITEFPGYYGDLGTFAFYRARLTANAGGGAGLTVIAQR